MLSKCDVSSMENQIIPGLVNPRRSLRIVAPYIVVSLALALLTYAGYTLRASSLTIGFIYLALVIAVAYFSGFWTATFTSILAAGLLDYFFVQPIFSFSIASPQDYIALGEFEMVALVISRVHAGELRGTSESRAHRKSMEQLYELSRNSLLMDMHQPPGSQLTVLIQRIFKADGVALYDVNLDRQDRSGEWSADDENIARECFLSGLPKNDPKRELSQRILLSGQGSVGSLVVRGKIAPLVVDALAALAAIAIDRHMSVAKEERAENASKGEQLRAAVMDALAHEFKTPLTAVQTSSSGLLALGGLTELQRNLVTLIDDETTRLNALCTKLLLTAKLEAEQVGLKRDEVNLGELIVEVVGKTPGTENKDRILIDVADQKLTLRVDRELLSMILIQYINNALKYSKPLTHITVSAYESHAEAIISVHNYGSVIRIEDRERIFDRFYRSPDLKDSKPGTGIGLSVVRKAAEAHHGHVWVISSEDEGTTFFLSLPTGARRKH